MPGGSITYTCHLAPPSTAPPSRVPARPNEGHIMKITVIGTGAIGGNLAVKLRTAGHDVQVADARGIEAVRAEVLESGVRAVELEESVQGRDAIILAIPFGVAGQLADLFASV